MKFLSFVLFLLVLGECEINGQPRNEGVDLYKAVQKHFRMIDSLYILNPDTVQSEESKFEELIRKNKQYFFHSDEASTFEWLYVTKSADKKFCLISWDTKLGGTMIDYATMAIFKKQNGELESEMLYDSTEGNEIINTLLNYDTIYTVSNAQHTFYLAQGFGQGSTALPWQEIKAFGISNNRLINPTIFPGNTFDIRIEFDTHEFNSPQRIPVIKVLEKAHKIRVPEPTHKGGFSGTYQIYILNGRSYKCQ